MKLTALFVMLTSILWILALPLIPLYYNGVPVSTLTSVIVKAFLIIAYIIIYSISCLLYNDDEDITTYKGDKLF